jgi:hypothetical protein
MMEMQGMNIEVTEKMLQAAMAARVRNYREEDNRIGRMASLSDLMHAYGAYHAVEVEDLARAMIVAALVAPQPVAGHTCDEGKAQWDAVAALLGADGDDVDAVLNAAMRAVMSAPGAAGIVAERRRQIEEEGYDAPHDDKWQADQLIGAAMSYLHAEWHGSATQPPMWPWTGDYWKPQTRRRNLERAGALIAAELARMDREEAARRAPKDIA